MRVERESVHAPRPLLPPEVVIPQSRRLFVCVCGGGGGDLN